MPRWFTNVTRSVFNPRELRAGKRPVLTHVGRVSGAEHRTPLDAHPVDGGFVFVPVYGIESDWCRNAIAAGRARLTIGDEEFELTNPTVIGRTEARELLDDDVRLPSPILRIREFLRMDTAAG